MNSSKNNNKTIFFTFCILLLITVFICMCYYFIFAYFPPAREREHTHTQMHTHLHEVYCKKIKNKIIIPNFKAATRIASYHNKYIYTYMYNFKITLNSFKHVENFRKKKKKTFGLGLY